MRKFRLGGLLGFMAVVAILAYTALAGVTGSFNLEMAAQAQETGNVPGGVLGNTSDSEFWRQVRRGSAGKVSIPDLKSVRPCLPAE